MADDKVSYVWVLEDNNNWDDSESVAVFSSAQDGKAWCATQPRFQEQRDGSEIPVRWKALGKDYWTTERYHWHYALRRVPFGHGELP